MSDATTTARSARESLAGGLNALQSDRNIPPQLLDLAEPIAQAMGALHQIEKGGDAALTPNADVALNNVRTALAQLQSQPSQHPAVLAAMEAVAGSLGLVHQLAKMAQAPAAQQQPQSLGFAPTQAVPQQRQQPYQAPQPEVQPIQPPTAFQRPSQDAFGAPAFLQQQQQPAFPPPQQQFQPAPQAPYQPPPQQQYQQPPQQQFQPPQQDFQQGNPYAQQQAARAPTAQQPQQPVRQADPFANPGAMPVGDLPAVNADLGAHSPSNFYKGLSGNDIVDHGGLFVSTYKIPKIGSPVRLKVALPGGYEFEANGIVRWSREPVDGGTNDAPPGFGAQFTEITPEARQLVYRYVRNREPLFHDDL